MSIAFFDRLKLRQKFLCLGFLCLAVIFLPSYLYVSEVNKSINFSVMEQAGIIPVRDIFNIVESLQKHRALAAQSLTTEIALGDFQNAQSAITNAFVRFQNKSSALHVSDIVENVSAQQKSWSLLEQKLQQKNLDLTASIHDQTDIILVLLKALRGAVDGYELSLDPQANGYFLIDGSLMKLPQMIELISQMQVMSLGIISRHHVEQIERDRLASLASRVASSLEELNSTIEKAAAAETGSSSEIKNNYNNIATETNQFLQLITTTIMASDSLPSDDAEINKVFADTIENYYRFSHFSVNKIDSILVERINSERNSMHLLLFYILSITMLAAAICVRFVRKVLKELGGEPSYAMQVVQTIADGDLDQPIVTLHPESLLANMQQMQFRLKENDRLKTEFVSTVSHELRTPLTAVNGAVSVVLSGKMGDIDARAQNVLAIAQKNAVRLTELINDLLDFDKLAAGKLELQCEPQMINGIVADAVATMTAYAEKFAVKLIFVPDENEAKANIDARRLQQVVINLISNAIKFSPQGDAVKILVIRKNDKVRVEVIDRGVGIAPEFHARIFKKFSQADSSDTRKVGGTGLGLAISRELISQMNGDIGFQSSLGEGSTFYFELPLVE